MNSEETARAGVIDDSSGTHRDSDSAVSSRGLGYASSSAHPGIVGVLGGYGYPGIGFPEVLGFFNPENGIFCEFLGQAEGNRQIAVSIFLEDKGVPRWLVHAESIEVEKVFKEVGNMVAIGVGTGSTDERIIELARIETGLLPDAVAVSAWGVKTEEGDGRAPPGAPDGRGIGVGIIRPDSLHGAGRIGCSIEKGM